MTLFVNVPAGVLLGRKGGTLFSASWGGARGNMASATGSCGSAVRRSAMLVLGSDCGARCQCLLLALCVLSVPWSARGRSLEEALLSTFPAQLRGEGEGLATAFSRSVAASFPVTGTSAACAYRFDPEIDSYRRLDIPLGPVFSERAETVGNRKLSVMAGYVLIPYDELNGEDLDNLVSNDPTQTKNHITICNESLQCEPVLGTARVDLKARILALSATYGITPDLDVSIFFPPFVRTDLRVATSFAGPDPRAPASPAYFPYALEQTASETSTGVGDLLLRAKYVLSRETPVDLAAGLTLSIPTGDAADFHGTGDTMIGAALYASHVYLTRVEPHVNLRFVLDADKFDRSEFRYSVGADVRLLDWLTLNNDFLGRSDIAASDTVGQPVFVEVGRADVFQLSTGFKMAPPWHRTLHDVPVLGDVPERGVGLPWAWYFNVLLPINHSGVRSDHIFTLGAEGVF